MRKAEYVFVASTFDDFIDHAADYHKFDKKIESAVLCSAVFEDSVRRYSGKMGIVQAGRSLDSVIDDLSKGGAVTPVKAKKVEILCGCQEQRFACSVG